MTEGLWGCYVIEIPGADGLKAERHMYEEIYLVVEGRGTTEAGRTARKHQLSGRRVLFSIPMNAWHRVINARRHGFIGRHHGAEHGQFGA
jgi:mannose-6-phosphate isomerase-like protein (cupin superfamily)